MIATMRQLISLLFCLADHGDKPRHRRYHARIDRECRACKTRSPRRSDTPCAPTTFWRGETWQHQRRHVRTCTHPQICMNHAQQRSDTSSPISESQSTTQLACTLRYHALASTLLTYVHRCRAAQFLAVSSVGMGGALFLFGVAWWDRDLRRVEKKHDDDDDDSEETWRRTRPKSSN